jgi:hypothetical protein
VCRTRRRTGQVHEGVALRVHLARRCRTRSAAEPGPVLSAQRAERSPDGRSPPASMRTAVRHPSFPGAETSAAGEGASRTVVVAPTRSNPMPESTRRSRPHRAGRSSRAGSSEERSSQMRRSAGPARPEPGRRRRGRACGIARSRRCANGSVYAVGKVSCRRWSAVGSGAATRGDRDTRVAGVRGGRFRQASIRGDGGGRSVRFLLLPAGRQAPRYGGDEPLSIDFVSIFVSILEVDTIGRSDGCSRCLVVGKSPVKGQQELHPAVSKNPHQRPPTPPPSLSSLWPPPR